MKYKSHALYMSDFESYVVRTEMASAEGDKLTLVFVPVTNEVMYRVTAKNGVSTGHKTLAEAIEAYNEI